MNVLLLICVCLLLTGCGGGGGGSHDVVPPVAAVITSRPMLFAYFGAFKDQVQRTASHVNCFFPMAWNFENWTPQGRVWIADQMISQLEEARNLGITKFIVGVDFLIFNYPYSYRGTADLAVFVDRLKSRGLWNYVECLYPIDEPDLQGLSDATMNQVNTEVKAFGKPVMCIYTDRRQWPGLSTVDRCAFDKYGVDWRGDGVLDDMKSRMRPDQQYFFVVGGMNPWRDNVRPVLDRANADPKCAGIVAFMWGPPKDGIADNGMLNEYMEVGTKIKQAK